jgi:hypothetical protein
LGVGYLVFSPRMKEAEAKNAHLNQQVQYLMDTVEKEQQYTQLLHGHVQSMGGYMPKIDQRFVALERQLVECQNTITKRQEIK